MLKVILMRHGESEWNVFNRIQGIQQVSLTDKGKKQIEKACFDLLSNRNIQVTKIITSPLHRAKESASICQRILNLPLVELDYFRERSFGELEGKILQEIRLQYKIRDIEELEDNRFSIEPVQSLLDRIHTGLKELKVTYPNENLLIITHGSVIKWIFEKYQAENIGIIPNGEYRCIKI
ncbi:MAG: histidine phosphatase family protein [Tepidibacillus sp.]|uniref:histidine phosphatase family protein n=1 Tax=Tepidibacillus sp. HK-1 TaxID=1883407 RepID=UPI0008538513|nr:histidine phosphatase family protein [Tepidibacillus sp. HK-1]GBF11200.1 phosphoserine phosphatase 1 [Tepidibacillus sp. HK-1]